MTCGLPSSSAKCVAITGICSVAARAIACAIRCVKETLWPAALSCLRRASRLVTVKVRNEVAVGICARLVHVAREHRARALEQGLLAAVGRAGGLGRSGDAPFSWNASTSALPMRPSGPVPVTLREVDPVRGGDARGDRRDLEALGRADRLGVARAGASRSARASGRRFAGVGAVAATSCAR